MAHRKDIAPIGGVLEKPNRDFHPLKMPLCTTTVSLAGQFTAAQFQSPAKVSRQGP